MKTVPEKLGLKSGLRAIFIDAPAALVADVSGAPGMQLSTQLRGDFGIILAFVENQGQLDGSFDAWKRHLVVDGRLWIAWPKSGGADSDLNIKQVIRIGYEHGMVESNAIRIDDQWSALKFTHPIAGKAYANSYGTLNESAVRFYRKAR